MGNHDAHQSWRRWSQKMAFKVQAQCGVTGSHQSSEDMDTRAYDIALTRLATEWVAKTQSIYICRHQKQQIWTPPSICTRAIGHVWEYLLYWAIWGRTTCLMLLGYAVVQPARSSNVLLQPWCSDDPSSGHYMPTPPKSYLDRMQSRCSSIGMLESGLLFKVVQFEHRYYSARLP